MSQFYDQASLVMVPSGYKAGKVYSQKPLTTDGQLTFTRTGDTATRVNADGLVEKVRTNLLLQSNQFDTTWTTTSTSVTSGQSGYDGTNDAWKLTKSAASGRLQQGTFSAGVYSFSVYLKADTNNWVQLYLDSTTATDPNCFFDLENGTIGTGTNNIDATIKSVGNGWYRCSVIGNVGTTFSAMIFPAEADNDKSATSGSIYIQNAQLEVSDFGPTDYIPTTTSEVSVGPVANLPRIDYTGGGCGKLLLEPQRTNLALYSEQFDNAAWTKSTGGASTVNVTANYAISPDGYQNADRIQLTRDAAGFAQVVQTASVTSGQVYTFSVYLKSLSGTPTVMFGSYGGTNAQTATLTNEWVRYTWTATAPSTSAFPMLMIWGGVASTSLSADFLAWGYQFEAGSYVSSYVNTLSAAVTRGADAAYKTGISSLIGQTEGTLFVEVDTAVLGDVYSGYSRRFLTISDGTTSNRINIYQSFSNDSIQVSVSDAGATQANFGTSGNQSGIKKIAVGYANNDFVMYVNGEQIGTDTSGSVPACNRLSVGSFETIANSSNSACPVSQTLLFTSRLTNAQLAELTTL